MLEISNLTKEYKHKVLDGINLSLDEPGIYALVGPNGMGKTTFMDTITNLRKKDSGKVKIAGIDNSDPSIFRHISYARDPGMLYSNLTGLDHFNFMKTTMGVSDEDFKEVLDVFKVTDFMKRRVSSYSTGMKQKTLLTSFFLGDYDIYMMDEPVSGLDPTSIIDLRNYLKDLEKRNKIIIFSSHTLSEVDQLTTRVIFLKDGKLIRKNLADLTYKAYSISYMDQGEEKKVKIRKNDLDPTIDKLKAKGSEIVRVEDASTSTEDIYIDMYR